MSDWLDRYGNLAALVLFAAAVVLAITWRP